MGKLTLQLLKDMPPEIIFDSGLFTNSNENKREHIFMVNSPEYMGETFVWVAKRGVIHDWTIYACPAKMGLEYCINSGDKIINEKNIKALVPCTDAAFKMYRY